MKKLLFSAYSLDYGGIETALVTLLNYLAQKYDITLVLEKKQGVFLDKLPKNITIVTYEPSRIKINIVRKCVNLIKQTLFRLKYKDKFDFSACYATYSYSCSFVARTASKNSALWVHNNYLNFYNNDIEQYRSFFKKLKVENYKNIIFVSELDKKTFIAQFPECSKKAIACNNLIDYKAILEKSKEKVNDISKTRKITFINIGRHDEKQKKLSRIIDATERLNNEGYKFRVLLVGKGPETSIYRKASNKIKNIIFVGAKKNPYPYLELSDCFLMSSQFEGYPVVLIEALILGKPIVTTNVSDTEKDIKDKYGIVVDNSSDGVYEGMKRFLDSGFSTKEFEPEIFNQEIIKKIERIIEDKKA